MVLLANTIRFLGDLLAVLFFLETVLIAAQITVHTFFGSRSLLGQVLHTVSEPIVLPFRRVSAALGSGAHLASLLAVGFFLVLHLAARSGAEYLAGIVAGPLVTAPDPGAAVFLRLIVNAYMLAIVLRILAEWLSPAPLLPFARLLTLPVEPGLALARMVAPPASRRLDFAPLILLAGCWFTERVVLDGFLQLAYRSTLLVAR